MPTRLFGLRCGRLILANFTDTTANSPPSPRSMLEGKKFRLFFQKYFSTWIFFWIFLVKNIFEIFGFFFLSTLNGGEGDWGPMVGIGQYAWDEPCTHAASAPVLLSSRKTIPEKSARNSRPHQTGNAEKSVLNESSGPP